MRPNWTSPSVLIGTSTIGIVLISAKAYQAKAKLAQILLERAFAETKP